MYQNGAPLCLKTVGKAIHSVANDKVVAWYNNKPSIILVFQKQPNTNTLSVIESVKKILPIIKKRNSSRG